MISYLLQGFGYADVNDFKRSVFRLLNGDDSIGWSFWSMIGGLLTYITGLYPIVFLAFVLLIFAEFWTGIKVALRVRGEKIQSRKMGRMFLKVGVYIFIITLLNLFSKQVAAPEILGVDLNPFIWLYYAVFFGITAQLLISWVENLSMLGYKETKGLVRVISKAFGKYFEFDGEKDNSDK